MAQYIEENGQRVAVRRASESTLACRLRATPARLCTGVTIHKDIDRSLRALAESTDALENLRKNFRINGRCVIHAAPVAPSSAMRLRNRRMFMKRSLVFIMMVGGLGIGPLLAQVPGPGETWLPNPDFQPRVNATPVLAAASAENEELGVRMARLEAENQRMQAELAAMRGDRHTARCWRQPGGRDHCW